MKRINILVNSVIISSAYKSNAEYQSWIDYGVANNLWGEVGTYTVEVIDATAEYQSFVDQAATTKKVDFDSHVNNGASSRHAVGNSSNVNLSYVSNTLTADLTDSGVVPGTYSLVSFDAKGRATFGSNIGSITRYSCVNNTTVVNSNATFTTVSDLTTASLPVGLYSFRFLGLAQSGSTTNGMGVRINSGSATLSTVMVKWNISQAANGTAQTYQYDQIALSTNLTSASVQAANTNFAVLGVGLFRVTTSGTVVIQIRSELNGTAVSLLADSFLEVNLV
jgi:hypothetical protein